MNAPFITDCTRETPIPEHVKGLSWKIDDVHSFAFNDYGGIDLCHKHKHGVQGRYAIKDARNYVAALSAMLSALDGNQPPVNVEVVNWGLQSALQSAEQAIEKLDAVRARLDESVARAKAIGPPSEGDPTCKP